MTINRDAIQHALRQVHATEKTVLRRDGLGRVESVRAAIKDCGLNEDEKGILLGALHVDPADLG
jgi:hypothetical protein